jgi:hypothetical protein
MPTGLRPAPTGAEAAEIKLPSAAVHGAIVVRQTMNALMLFEPEFAT